MAKDRVDVHLQAIVGQLAGAIYGYESIPVHLLRALEVRVRDEDEG